MIEFYRKNWPLALGAGLSVILWEIVGFWIVPVMLVVTLVVSELIDKKEEEEKEEEERR